MWPDRAHARLEGAQKYSSGLVFHRFRLFSIVVGAIAAVFIAVAAWNVVLNFVAPKDPDERISLLSTLAQITGGLFLLLGLYFTARTYLVNREGQITERFSRAIDHLGKDELAIRLGGIYALERIARDSPRDQRQIVEILTAFVRETAPASTKRRDAWEELVRSGDDPGSMISPWMDDGLKIKPDVQAILTILGRRERGPERGEPIAVDLSGADLRKASWSDAYLPKALLVRCDLEGSWMKWADLSGAMLSGSNLREATLAGATLRDAWVQHAFAVGAYFTSVDFRGANVYGSAFQWAQFQDAEMSHVGFHKCNLDNANFWNTRLVVANFTSASLNGTGFDGADLTHANFRGVDLSKCRDLTAEQIASAQTDEKTILPPSLRPAKEDSE
jgi:hypothetical protein